VNEVEAKAWRDEQRFIITVFLFGIPVCAAAFFFYRLLSPPDNFFLSLVFHDWFAFCWSCVAFSYSYAIIAWKAMSRKDKSREGKH
jgi:hypothetical protein